MMSFLMKLFSLIPVILGYVQNDIRSAFWCLTSATFKATKMHTTLSSITKYLQGLTLGKMKKFPTFYLCLIEYI